MAGPVRPLCSLLHGHTLRHWPHGRPLQQRPYQEEEVGCQDRHPAAKHLAGGRECVGEWVGEWGRRMAAGE
jgi:hypothetical protein